MATPASDVRPQGPATAADATITVSSAAATCSQIGVAPDPFTKQRNQEILWQVNNTCGSDATITVDNWLLNGQPNNPTAGTKSMNVPANGSRPLSLMVKADATLGTYKYSIYVAVNGQQQGELDPGVII